MQGINFFGGLGIYDEKSNVYLATISVGRYENCREQGYVFSVKYRGYQKNYAVYEHRNSDSLCVIAFEEITINTPTLDMVTSRMKDKWDVTKSFSCGEIMECGNWIREDIREFVTKIKEQTEKEKNEVYSKEVK